MLLGADAPAVRRRRDEHDLDRIAQPVRAYGEADPVWPDCGTGEWCAVNWARPHKFIAWSSQLTVEIPAMSRSISDAFAAPCCGWGFAFGCAHSTLRRTFG